MDSLKRRSKIEICIEILSILAQRGLSRITHIMYNTNTNCSLLKEIMVFIIKFSSVVSPIISIINLKETKRGPEGPLLSVIF